MRASVNPSSAGSPAIRRRSARSVIGTMAGARSAFGKSFPAACISVSRAVRGATVRRSEPAVRAARAPSARTMSAAP
ncbi:hypothetical protein GCM10007886_25380 [Methylobacterium gregans]|nr:hypothetical protein GCM10007886_25380 [Methylobacterium gregans]